jgi:hypothetical protein
MQKPFQPENQSLALANKFRLTFNRLPEVTFFCQSINVPGISMNPTQFTTPFVDLPIPGDKAQFDELRVQFLVDEDYKTWQSLFDWIVGMTFPENFEQYVNLSKLRRDTISSGLSHNAHLDYSPQYSDASLFINTNKNNKNLKFKFIDMFPISVGTIDLSEEFTPENTITCEAVFKYSYFTLERL